VEGVIGERIARLEPGLRETLRVGSVVGTDFAAQVVARVQKAQERELVRQLSRELDKRHHLIHEQGETRIGRQFLSVFRFSHALFQQFLYNDLGAGERRGLHGDVAEALEALYAGHTDEIALQLAQHYQEAGDDENAAVYLIRAGDAAFGAYANSEAAAHYSRALSLGAQSLPAEQLQHLYARRGRAYELNQQYEAALQNYEEMRGVARRCGDRQMELAGLLATATLHSVLSGVPDAAKGEELSKAALKVALELGDHAGEAKALWNLMLVHLWLKGDQPQAIAYGEQSLAIARELKLEEQTAYSTTDLAAAYLFNGQLDEAEAKFDVGCGLWQTQGNLRMLAYNLNQYMVPLLIRGKYEKMFQVGEENYQASQASKTLWNEGPLQMLLSYVWMERGEFARALEVL
jgi:predicted ATPase